jgi:hypothetical protein
MEAGGTFLDFLGDLAKHTAAHDSAPKSYTELLSKYGKWVVDVIYVVRVPVTTVIQKAVKAVTTLKNDAMLYHLLAVLHLEYKNRNAYIRIEKHSEICWKPFDMTPARNETQSHFIERSFPHGEVLKVQCGLQLSQLLRGAEDIASSESRSFFSYESIEANCQQFIKWLIAACGKLTPAEENFIVQKGLEKHIHGAQRTAMHAITTLAGGVKRLLESHMEKTPPKKRKRSNSKRKVSFTY